MKYRLGDIIEFNPKEKLSKGKKYKKISMEMLKPYKKYIENYTEEEYKGGSKFRNGDTLLARITPCLENGKTAQVNELEENEIGFGSTEFIVMRAKIERSDKDFIYYLSINKEFRNIAIKSMTGTSGRQRAQVDVLKDTIMDLPEYNEQVKIAKILSCLDRKIELNNQINNNLQQIIKEYYYHIINNEKEYSLAEFMNYQGGSQPPAKEFEYEKNENNIRFVQIRDFDTDSHICYIPISKKNKLCKKNDILIARYGASLGRICYGLDGAYNVALAKVIPQKEEYREMLRVILESAEFYNYINAVGQRSAQAGFNAGDIQGFKIKIPNEDNLEKFNKLAKEFINKRLLINEENKMLKQLRDILLPKLMNGKIDLNKIKI